MKTRTVYLGKIKAEKNKIQLQLDLISRVSISKEQQKIVLEWLSPVRGREFSQGSKDT